MSNKYEEYKVTPQLQTMCGWCKTTCDKECADCDFLNMAEVVSEETANYTLARYHDKEQLKQQINYCPRCASEAIDLLIQHGDCNSDDRDIYIVCNSCSLEVDTDNYTYALLDRKRVLKLEE